MKKKSYTTPVSDIVMVSYEHGLLDGESNSKYIQTIDNTEDVDGVELGSNTIHLWDEEWP